MIHSKWSQRIVEQWKSVSVHEYIDGIQQLYKKWMIICAVIVTGGAAMIAASSNPRMIAFGLFLSTAGIINIAVTKLWVHMKLSMIRIVYELREKNQSYAE